MKTRREFFKTLAGSMAVVAACVMVPQSLIAKKVVKLESDPNVPWIYREPLHLERNRGRTADYVTSGYTQADVLKPLERTITNAYPKSSMARIRGRDGLTRLHWSSGETLNGRSS